MKAAATTARIEQLSPRMILNKLEEKTRTTRNQAELEFMVVNESIGLCGYRQAAFWHDGQGVRRLSGVVQVEANTPYVQWLNRLCASLSKQYRHTQRLEQTDLTESLATEWSSWLPQHLLWVPLDTPSISRQTRTGGLIFANETGFSQQDADLIEHWCRTWFYAWVASGQAARGLDLTGLFSNTHGAKASWWKRPYVYLLLGGLLALHLPVNLTLLAPAELIPKDPVVIRSPMDGVIDEVLVAPNAQVETGTPLFNLDQEKLLSQYNIAQREMAGLQTQYNQVVQLSLSDNLQKAQLASIAAEIDQKDVAIQYLQGQLQRSEVKATVMGTILYPSTDELEGKPVQTGEGVMRLVNPEKVQVEAWLGVADAVPIPNDAEMVLYLSSMPTQPVHAQIHLIGYEPVLQPSGSYAYRIRADIRDDQPHRVGLKGIAKIVADKVPLYYWIFRRPLSSLRQFLGI
jgi:hypothetical protein